MGYLKLMFIILGIVFLIGSTVYAASLGTFYFLIGLLIFYFIIFLIIERSMYSFVAPTKPYLHTKNPQSAGKKDELAAIFAMAEKYIHIMSGKLRDDIYKNALTELKKAIDKRNVEVEIIAEEEPDRNTLNSLLPYLKEDKIKLYRLQDYQVSGHFIVVDDADVRIEKLHKPEEEKIEADYWYSYRRLGNHLNRKFEKIKDISNKIAFPRELK